MEGQIGDSGVLLGRKWITSQEERWGGTLSHIVPPGTVPLTLAVSSGVSLEMGPEAGQGMS